MTSQKWLIGVYFNALVNSGRLVKQERWEYWRAKRKLVSGSKHQGHFCWIWGYHWNCICKILQSSAFFYWKMVRKAIHIAFVNTLTMGTSFPLEITPCLWTVCRLRELSIESDAALLHVAYAWRQCSQNSVHPTPSLPRVENWQIKPCNTSPLKTIATASNRLQQLGGPTREKEIFWRKSKQRPMRKP